MTNNITSGAYYNRTNAAKEDTKVNVLGKDVEVTKLDKNKDWVVTANEINKYVEENKADFITEADYKKSLTSPDYSKTIQEIAGLFTKKADGTANGNTVKETTKNGVKTVTFTSMDGRKETKIKFKANGDVDTFETKKTNKAGEYTYYNKVVHNDDGTRTKTVKEYNPSVASLKTGAPSKTTVTEKGQNGKTISTEEKNYNHIDITGTENPITKNVTIQGEVYSVSIDTTNPKEPKITLPNSLTTKDIYVNIELVKNKKTGNIDAINIKSDVIKYANGLKEVIKADESKDVVTKSGTKTTVDKNGNLTGATYKVSDDKTYSISGINFDNTGKLQFPITINGTTYNADDVKYSDRDGVDTIYNKTTKKPIFQITNRSNGGYNLKFYDGEHSKAPVIIETDKNNQAKYVLLRDTTTGKTNERIHCNSEDSKTVYHRENGIATSGDHISGGKVVSTSIYGQNDDLNKGKVVEKLVYETPIAVNGTDGSYTIPANAALKKTIEFNRTEEDGKTVITKTTHNGGKTGNIISEKTTTIEEIQSAVLYSVADGAEPPETSDKIVQSTTNYYGDAGVKSTEGAQVTKTVNVEYTYDGKDNVIQKDVVKTENGVTSAYIQTVTHGVVSNVEPMDLYISNDSSLSGIKNIRSQNTGGVGALEYEPTKFIETLDMAHNNYTLNDINNITNDIRNNAITSIFFAGNDKQKGDSGTTGAIHEERTTNEKMQTYWTKVENQILDGMFSSSFSSYVDNASQLEITGEVPNRTAVVKSVSESSTYSKAVWTNLINKATDNGETISDKYNNFVSLLSLASKCTKLGAADKTKVLNLIRDGFQKCLQNTAAENKKTIFDNFEKEAATGATKLSVTYTKLTVNDNGSRLNPENWPGIDE